MEHQWFKNIYKADDENLRNLSDGTLRTEDGYVFDIHKIALAENSKYFYELFCGNTENNTVEILIPRMKGEVFDKILYHIYTGNFICTEDTLVDILIASDRLSLSNLQNDIKEYLKLNISNENCMQILIASHDIKLKDIYLMSLRYLQIHFEEVANNSSSEIVNMPLYILKELLSNRNLCVISERSIWKWIVKWIVFDKTRRQVHTPNLLTCLKVADIDEELACTIIEHDIVARNPFCKDMSKLEISGNFDNDHQIIHHFCKMYQGLIPENEKHRLPSEIYICIVYMYIPHAEGYGRFLYVTYDENLDIWRNFKYIGNGVNSISIITLGKCIYIFKMVLNNWVSLENFLIFNIDEEIFIEPENAALIHNHCCILKHEGYIYAFQVRNILGRQATYSDRVYNPSLNLWYDVPLMIPVIFIAVASLGKNIYVVGRDPDHWNTNIAQEYNPETNYWSPIAYPKYQGGLLCILVPYYDRLYFLSSYNKRVEVFDPVGNFWSNTADLPSAYLFPSAKVFEDQLIVYETASERYRWTYPMVRWSNELESWEPIEKSSQLYKLICYGFNIVQDFDSIKAITADNRKNMTSFKKFPLA